MGKDSRSLSDRDNPSGKSTPLPSRLPVKQKQSACFSSQADGDQLSDVPEPSVRSAVYTDVSSADPKSPHSVIFKYDSPISFSSDPKTRLPLGARPSSVTEDVFESRPIWDDTVETQMQRIVDDQTPEQHQGILPPEPVWVCAYLPFLLLCFVAARSLFSQDNSLVTFQLCTFVCCRVLFCVSSCAVFFLLFVFFIHVCMFMKSQD